MVVPDARKSSRGGGDSDFIALPVLLKSLASNRAGIYAWNQIGLIMNCSSVPSILGVLFIFSVLPPNAMLAGGTCILHPEPFRLQSDAVRWSIKIVSGGECIQGLRWSTIMIGTISITEQPKAGRLVIQGPSFRYFSDQGGRANDSFKLTIS